MLKSHSQKLPANSCAGLLDDHLSSRNALVEASISHPQELLPASIRMPDDSQSSLAAPAEAVGASQCLFVEDSAAAASDLAREDSLVECLWQFVSSISINADFCFVRPRSSHDAEMKALMETNLLCRSKAH